MLCPYCGTENDANAIYCKQCDKWILADMYVEETPPLSPPASEETVQEEAATPRPKRWKIVLLVGISSLLLVTLAVFFLGRSRPSGGNLETPLVEYVQYIAPYLDAGGLDFISNDTLLKTAYIPSQIQSSQQSLDGTAAAFLTDDDELYYVRDDTVHFISDFVTDFVLSSGGNGLSFSRFGEVYLYHTEIMDSVPVRAYSNSSTVDMVISPDGKCIAFLQVKNIDTAGQRHLYRFSLGDTTATKIGVQTRLTELISVSNDFTWLYMRDIVNILCSDAQGNVEQLGAYSLGSESHRYLYINADHSQVVYYAKEGTWLTEKGQPGRCISTECIIPIATALSHAPLRNRVYQTNLNTFLGQNYHLTKASRSNDMLSSTLFTYREELYHVDSNGNCSRLAEDVQKYWLDPTGRHLYYLTNTKQLLRLDTRQANSAITLAENVLAFTVAFDCSKVYYTTASGIYCCNGSDGSDRLLVDDLRAYTLYMTRDNRLYYQVLTMLYVCTDAQMGQQLTATVRSANYTNNGLLYITTPDGLYVSTPDGELKQLCDTVSTDKSVAPAISGGNIYG